MAKQDKTEGTSSASNRSRCLQTAIRLLARREHSRHELVSKLQQRQITEGVDLGALMDQLVQGNYLSDQRFAEMFVRVRIQRGQGPQKIQYELSQRGVDATLIAEIMQSLEVDWFILAQQQRQKRFGLPLPDNYKEQARQSRFLAGRGFFSNTIHMIFK
jgi:regulatory protein